MEIKINLVVVRKDHPQSNISYIQRIQNGSNGRVFDIGDVGSGQRRRVSESDFENEYREASIDEVADFYSQIQSIFESIMESMKKEILSRSGDTYKVSRIIDAASKSKDSKSFISSIRDIVASEDGICIPNIERVGRLRDSMLGMVSHEEFESVNTQSSEEISLLREVVSDRADSDWYFDPEEVEELLSHRTPTRRQQRLGKTL